jgi:hypothetical protein
MNLLHGTPSKKDFLDQIKQLKEKEKEDNDEMEIRISTDHDLQMYTSPAIINDKPKSIVNILFH